MSPYDVSHERPRDGGRAPGRREFLAVGIGVLVVAAVARDRRRVARVTRRTLPVMGTIAEVHVVHDSPRAAHAALDAAMAELQAVERGMSRFLPQSDVGRVNRRGATRPVPIATATHEVMTAALAWAQATDGAFDPAIGRVVEVWDVNGRHAPPPMPDVQRLAGRHWYRAVTLGWEAGAPAVALGDPEVRLDLGGIAKGFAIDRAVDALRARGIADALVNVGGDLYALGSAPDGAAWRVGVQAPDRPGETMGVLEVRDRAVATSGDYEQCFRYRGVRYHHLMDPATAAPRQVSQHSVTVEAASCMEADAAATAVFGMTSERANAVLAVRAHGARVVSWG